MTASCGCDAIVLTTSVCRQTCKHLAKVTKAASKIQFQLLAPGPHCAMISHKHTHTHTHTHTHKHKHKHSYWPITCLLCLTYITACGFWSMHAFGPNVVTGLGPWRDWVLLKDRMTKTKIQVLTTEAVRQECTCRTLAQEQKQDSFRQHRNR